MIGIGNFREELQHLSRHLEARASEKTADLIAAESHFDPSENLQKPACQSSLTGNAGTIQEAMADFTSLISIIQGYTTLLKDDLGDPIKVKEDLEAISEAISKSAWLVHALMPQTKSR